MWLYAQAFTCVHVVHVSVGMCSVKQIYMNVAAIVTFGC